MEWHRRRDGGKFVGQKRGGFTLVEVVIAASVLVIALFGILAMAFHTYKKTDVADEAITAANLATERLAYFRAHPNPFKAVGGTFYAPPRARNLVDLNLARGNNRARLHNVWNENPVLFAREWLYSTSESRYRNAAAGTDEGRDAARMRQREGANASAAERALRVNFIETTPVDISIDGVFPDHGVGAAKPAVQTEDDYPTALDGGSDEDFVYMPAPRANEGIRVPFNQLPASVRYVREVWVQTNHPLGKPFLNQNDESVRDVAIDWPAFYTGAVGTDIIDNFIKRGDNAVTAASGVATIRMPAWVITVTVRVYARDPLIKNLTDAGAVGRTKGALAGYDGLGYDPTKPLATAVGYFGVRHQLGSS